MSIQSGIVAIIDDNPADRKRLMAFLHRYAEENAINIEVDEFSCGKEFLMHYRDVYDGLIIDIRLPDMSGDEITAILRKRDLDIPILFCSSYNDAVFRGYELGVQNYIRKPLQYATVEKELHRMLAGKDRGKWILVETQADSQNQGNQLIKVYMRKLEYVETSTSGRYCIIHYDGQQIAIRKKLKEMENLLLEEGAGWFFRCHKSYIVNLMYVKKMTVPEDSRKYDLHMLSGDMVPMGKNRKDGFLEMMINLFNFQR